MITSQPSNSLRARTSRIRRPVFVSFLSLSLSFSRLRSFSTVDTRSHAQAQSHTHRLAVKPSDTLRVFFQTIRRRRRKKANDDGHDNDNNHSDTHSTLALSHLSSRRREKSVSHPKRPTTGVSPQRRLGQAHYAPPHTHERK